MTSALPRIPAAPKSRFSNAKRLRKPLIAADGAGVGRDPEARLCPAG